MSWDSQNNPDWKPCWKWSMMLCFHMLLRSICSITLHRIHVNEMGLQFTRSDLRLVLCIGVTSVWSQSSGSLEVLYDC